MLGIFILDNFRMGPSNTCVAKFAEAAPERRLSDSSNSLSSFA